MNELVSSIVRLAAAGAFVGFSVQLIEAKRVGPVTTGVLVALSAAALIYTFFGFLAALFIELEGVLP